MDSYQAASSSDTMLFESSASSWETVLSRQVGSIWGLVPCPLPPLTANSTDLIHYYADMGIDATHTCITVTCALILWFCYSGVQRVTMRESLDTVLEILPCYRDLDHGATSNTRFVIYYLCSAAASLLSLSALILDSQEVAKAYRIILQVAQRIFFGAAAVLLTIALNHQREHRHMDSLHGNLGIVQLVGQIRRINYSVITIYSLYIITEIGTSIVEQTHPLRIGMAALSFAIVVILNVPILASALWLSLHEAHVDLQLGQKIALLTGIIFRFVGTVDASFWNKIVMIDKIEADACPFGGKLALYNFMKILNCVGQFLILSFVVSEFRRSRSIVTQESALIATAQYDDFDDNSSNRSDGDLQRSASALY